MYITIVMVELFGDLRRKGIYSELVYWDILMLVGCHSGSVDTNTLFF